jgi:hypothetical protein
MGACFEISVLLVVLTSTSVLAVPRLTRAHVVATERRILEVYFLKPL